MLLAIAALLAASSALAARGTGQPALRASPAHHQEEEPGLEWFEGTFEELMSEARASKKIVFLDFWAEW